MMLKHLCLLILATVTCVAAQSEDEINIPLENDNQFPPDNISEPDEALIEGSGLGETSDIATTQSSAPLEDVKLSIAVDNTQTAPLPETAPEDTLCPKPCVCHIEGVSGDFVVDCSGYELTEFPSLLDIRTTTLNIKNNKLTEIPKEVSALKNLKVLNANDNSIMELASGSISELPELTTLKLGNNRLIEFPKDLKNSFGLTKLEELDLGGNDMRTALTPETFSNFIALRKLTLPTATTELLGDLCTAFQDRFEYVCIESCSVQTFECPNALQNESKDDLFNAILPGTIALSSAINNDNVDPFIFENTNIGLENTENTAEKKEPIDDSATEAPDSPKENDTETNKFSLRTAVSKAESSAGISPLSTLIEAPQETGDEHTKELGVSVGATTSNSKTGGIDKSVIGMIIAGMVLVVAGITIKKNWSSIKNKFSSSPRPANDRTPYTNGSAPEEVPLQENKSPV